AMERLVLSIPAFKSRYESLPPVLGMFYVYTVFSLAFFYFRCKPIALDPQHYPEVIASPIQVAWFMTERAFTFAQGQQAVLSWNAVALVALLMGLEWMQERKKSVALLERPVYVYAGSTAVLIVCLYVYSVTVSQPFVYFQF
ncbi:MAG: MBOAT family protein, partial [Spirochaetae bacterium HGW-Spirochaetae-10]